eukprot:g12197.t1
MLVQIILHLFENPPANGVREIVTRVLLERLIVHRPHPWGLLVTFIELIKNPKYRFWEHEFVRCAPEIERLFRSVGSTCLKEPGSGELTSGAVPVPGAVF